MIELNEQQKEAASLIKAWFEDEDRKQCFVLAGYAGTGKTFLINYMIKHVLNLEESEVAFLAPTGKAASIIIQRGNDASTIHRLIYNVVEKKIETKINGKKVVSRKTEFVKKQSIPKYKLLIVDEISMVDEKLLMDLLSFGIPALCCGDKGQLQPVLKTNGLLENPDFVLTQIVRQNENNSIVKIASLARKGMPIPTGSYGNVLVLDSRFLKDEDLKNLLLNCNQVICGTNKRRIEINDKIRKYKGYMSKYPEDGEKIIFTANNWEVFLDESEEYNLVNGTMGMVENFKMEDETIKLCSFDFTADFLNEKTESIMADAGYFENNTPTYDMHQRVLLLSNGEYALNDIIRKEDTEGVDLRERIIRSVMNRKNAIDDFQINSAIFGYAITAHKAQGSEWDTGVVFDDSKIFGNEAPNWLYTAITRFKKKLVIIK